MPVSPAPQRRALITATAILASMIYAIDWTIAAVALPHMQGTFSATQDQIAWVMTSYIVVSAITLPTTGWLSARLGRKRLFLISIGGFSVFSLFCGLAGSLTAEVTARVFQGCFVAYLIPLSQALMLDNYPPEQHAKATALWGLGAILGPVIGPTVGGWLTEEYSSRISRMNSDFLVRFSRIYYEFQRVVGSWSTQLWNTQRVNQMTAPCGSNSTAA